MKKMIVMDLDGTLLDVNKKISLQTKEYLLELKNKGFIIVIATGRILNSVISVTEGAEFANYIISNAGGLIYDNSAKKVIYKNVINKDIVSKICSLYSDDINCIELSDIYYYNRYTNKNITEDRFTKKINNLDEYIKNNEVISMTIGINNNIDSIYEYVLNNYKEVRSYIISVSFNHDIKNIEVVGLDVNKFNAIKKIANIENIEISNIITFGDSENDIEMIKNSGLGVAMKNAVEEVKKVSKYITKSNNENGIFEFLKQYLESEI